MSVFHSFRLPSGAYALRAGGRIPTSAFLVFYDYQPPETQLSASIIQFYFPVIHPDPAGGLIQAKTDGFGKQRIIDHAP